MRTQAAQCLGSLATNVVVEIVLQHVQQSGDRLLAADPTKLLNGLDTLGSRFRLEPVQYHFKNENLLSRPDTSFRLSGPVEVNGREFAGAACVFKRLVEELGKFVAHPIRKGMIPCRAGKPIGEEPCCFGKRA